MKALSVNPKLFLILIFLSLLILLLDTINLLAWPKSLLQTITVPIEYGMYQSGREVNRQLEFLRLIRRSAQENKALSLQLSELLMENAELHRQLRESRVLGEQYQKLSPDTFEMVPARVVGMSRYLVVDKGEEDGIKVDEVVVFRDNYLGLIKTVGRKTSQVLLTQDPDSKIAVFSQNNSGRAKGILLGQFGSELLMDKILHQEIVETGDLVYSEGSEGKLPKGLIVGKVAEVFERSNGVFKQAKVEPIWNLADLDMVFVIRSF